MNLNFHPQPLIYLEKRDELLFPQMLVLNILIHQLQVNNIMSHTNISELPSFYG